MRSRYLVYLVVILFIMAQSARAEGWRFPREIRLGARGPDVFALQRFLNESAQTRVAERGVGSPGKETNYFGPATARAVAAFQKLKSGEADFSSESGRVGPLTLAALNKRSAQDTNIRMNTNLPMTTNKTETKITSPAHPNARNMDQFLGIVKQVGSAQGRSADDLQKLSEEMRSFALSTTTDFFTQFAEEARGNSSPISLESSFKSRIGALLEKFASAFALRADAQAPSFGGMVVYVFPCTCSGNWLVGMLPLSIPPINLITQYTGSQAFAWFNAPFTLFMKGNYIPQGAPCLFYAVFTCVTLPSQAQTAPILGSS